MIGAVKGLDRNLLIAIAYYALWLLREADPEEEEPPYFKMTRIDLSERLDDDPEPSEPSPRHLRLVR
jgi:hypothetical protein